MPLITRRVTFPHTADLPWVISLVNRDCDRNALIHPTGLATRSLLYSEPDHRLVHHGQVQVQGRAPLWYVSACASQLDDDAAADLDLADHSYRSNLAHPSDASSSYAPCALYVWTATRAFIPHSPCAPRCCAFANGFHSRCILATDKRKAEAERIRQKYPDRIPVSYRV